MELHGLSRWRHGCSWIAPVSPRRRPSGYTVALGVFPVYHGIWQPSRLLPVSPGCFKHFKTTGDMSRFNTVHPGSPRLSTVPPRLWHGSSWFIPDHQQGWTDTLNRYSENGALRCRFIPVWWSRMNRATFVAAPWTTLEIRDEPCWTRSCPGCFKMFKTTGTHRE